MKKFLSLLLVFSTLTLTLPKKEANAGVLLFAASSIPSGHGPGDVLNDIGAMIGAIFIGFAGSAVGGVVSIFNPSVGLKIIYGSIILNADGSINQQSLEQSFSEKYNFIDNQEVINGLAKSIKTKYQQNKANAYVTLSEEETRSILEPAMLSEGEIAQVVIDLN